MQISFPILENINYQASQDFIRQEQAQVEISVEVYEEQLKSQKRRYWIYAGIFMLLLIADFFTEKLGFVMIAYVAIVIFILIIQKIFIESEAFGNSNSKFNSRTMSPKYIKKGKITLENDGIRLAQGKDNVLYLYRDMTNLKLFFLGVNSGNSSKLNTLRWNIGTLEHRYIFLIENKNALNQLLTALKYWYEKEISFKELDEYSEELYLLQVPEPPELPKEEIYEPIDEKYLRMIEEIGKREGEDSASG
jgi:hypothetical protein